MYDDSGFPTGVGHGVLCNIRDPVDTYCGGAKSCPSIMNCLILMVCFVLIQQLMWDPISPLNNAPELTGQMQVQIFVTESIRSSQFWHRRY